MDSSVCLAISFGIVQTAFAAAEENPADALYSALRAKAVQPIASAKAPSTPAR
jgi:hypothetical protein